MVWKVFCQQEQKPASPDRYLHCCLQLSNLSLHGIELDIGSKSFARLAAGGFFNLYSSRLNVLFVGGNLCIWFKSLLISLQQTMYL